MDRHRQHCSLPLLFPLHHSHLELREISLFRQKGLQFPIIYFKQLFNMFQRTIISFIQTNHHKHNRTTQYNFHGNPYTTTQIITTHFLFSFFPLFYVAVQFTLQIEDMFSVRHMKVSSTDMKLAHTFTYYIPSLPFFQNIVFYY